jgi:Holliday junction resolvase RusA-like endonuclease
MVALAQNKCGVVLDLPQGEQAGFVPSPEPACSFTCPLPPSINAAYKNIRRGRAKTAEHRAWADMALISLKQQKIAPVQGACVIIYGFERKSRMADASNRIKLTEDILVKAGIIEDDRFVTATALSWIPHANGLAHISIYPIGSLGLTLMPATDGATAAWVPFAPHQHEGEAGYGFVA